MRLKSLVGMQVKKSGGVAKALPMATRAQRIAKTKPVSQGSPRRLQGSKRKLQ